MGDKHDTIDKIGMELSILYFKGFPVNISIKLRKFKSPLILFVS